MRRVVWLLPFVVLVAPPALGGQGGGDDNKPLCGYLVQGYVRLPDGTPLRKAVAEELIEPHRTPAFRVRTDSRGWFEMGGGRRKKGALVLLRITPPGGAPTLVKLKIDPGCGVPVFVVTPGTAVTPTSSRTAIANNEASCRAPARESALSPLPRWHGATREDVVPRASRGQPTTLSATYRACRLWLRGGLIGSGAERRTRCDD